MIGRLNRQAVPGRQLCQACRYDQFHYNINRRELEEKNKQKTREKSN
jgi:hypothetical protein